MSPGILLPPQNPAQDMATLALRPSTDLNEAAQDFFIATLQRQSYDFLQPSQDLHDAALVLAKRALDPLASTISTAQAERLKQARKKRKRGDDDGLDKDMLRLKEVYLEGLDIDQVWEQARRVLEATGKEVERWMGEGEYGWDGKGFYKLEEEVEERRRGGLKTVRFDEEGFEEESSLDEDGLEDEGEFESMEDDGEDCEDENEDEDADMEGSEAEEELEGGEDIELLDDDDEDVSDVEDGTREVFQPDKHGLNDGFFSIDEFNKNSQFLEQQDARGDPNDGAASDEEEIDWTTDPMSMPLPKDVNGDKDSEEDGPTFGNADLNAPWSDDDEGSADEVDMDVDETTANTNDVLYADFFEPPPRPAGKNKKKRALPKTQPPKADPSGEEIQRTINAVKRDIFEDEDDKFEPGSDMDADEVAALANNKNLSTHERRQAAISAQIRKLEAENVAKRDWTLSGEARAVERPLNSLLEEDLEFERTGKPVPVITAEISEDIEALIKRRIIAREFDEVIKRRPGDLALGASAPRRGRVELDDTKNDMSLAEIYEQEHLKKTDPDYVDKRDATLKKAHEDIERMWVDVSSKLDALTSLHYRPKPPTVNVQVVSDVPKIIMEDARPAGVAIGTEESRLAPQEVYKTGEDKEKGEVVVGTGVVRKEEMTKEEKIRRRRREKERIKKAGGGDGGKRVEKTADGKPKVVPGESKKGKERKELMEGLKKGGVKIIGKGGEVRDVEGKIAVVGGGSARSGAFKL